MAVRELFDLSGKVALVTGGSRGLGLQLALALGEMGAKVAISARKADELKAAAARLAEAKIDALTVVNDLSKAGQVPPLVDAVTARFGTIDVLVNNAGTTWGAPAEAHPLEAWDKVIGLNLTAAFALSQAVANRCFIPRRRGVIINMASIAGLRADMLTQSVAYNASKAGLLSMTRALAGEWGRYGIRVNAICPGFFPSKMTHAVLGQVETKVLERTPLGRIGGDEDLMGTVVFLAADASRHMTGQALVVDGGITAV